MKNKQTIQWWKIKDDKKQSRKTKCLCRRHALIY